jgi:hypothetical protein
LAARSSRSPGARDPSVTVSHFTSGNGSGFTRRPGTGRWRARSRSSHRCGLRAGPQANPPRPGHRGRQLPSFSALQPGVRAFGCPRKLRLYNATVLTRDERTAIGWRLAIAIAFNLVTVALAEEPRRPRPRRRPRAIYVPDFEAHTGDAAGGGTPRRVPFPSYATCARVRRP